MRSKIQPKKKTSMAGRRRSTKPTITKTTKKAAPAAKKSTGKKTSALEAAAKVLADTKTAMTTGEMVEAMVIKKLWTSPGGKTPDRTLYSAILREIATKGKDARFKKTERGKFGLATN